jgi:hypothetical protein
MLEEKLTKAFPIWTTKSETNVNPDPVNDDHATVATGADNRWRILNLSEAEDGDQVLQMVVAAPQTGSHGYSMPGQGGIDALDR